MTCPGSHNWGSSGTKTKTQVWSTPQWSPFAHSTLHPVAGSASMWDYVIAWTLSSRERKGRKGVYPITARNDLPAMQARRRGPCALRTCIWDLTWQGGHGRCPWRSNVEVRMIQEQKLQSLCRRKKHGVERDWQTPKACLKWRERGAGWRNGRPARGRSSHVRVPSESRAFDLLLRSKRSH